MKIVSWNCLGKFREKYKIIQELNADIYIIQECENPKEYVDKFKDFYLDYEWVGETKSKGLGIFVRKGIKIQNNNWETYCLRHFLSVKINGDFDLLGVWAGKPYIEEYYIYQSIHKDKYNDNTIIIGDFNSNAIWDSKYNKRNHGAVVKELSEKNLVSAYHWINNEKHGQENQNTFYLYKHKDRKYHIDYCFIAKDRIKGFQILENDEWLNYSDHMPIVVEI